MSQNDSRKGTITHVPAQDETPSERRRVLNILAQRRYRKRKQARIQELEGQLEDRRIYALSSPAPRHESGISLESSGIGYPEEQSMVSMNESDAAEAAFQPTFLPDDFLATLRPELDIETEWMNITDPVSPTPTNMLSNVTQNRSAIPASLQPQADPEFDFADYAITTPGLSVMRAHVTIIRNLYGPDFHINMWDPCTLSPFCTQSGDISNTHLPASFQPSLLQKRVQHHPVVDCLPWRSFRDRFLYVMSLPMEMRPKIAQQDMPLVTLELMFALKDAGGGLRVWDLNPFASEHWEISHTFYSKFWWAIDGDIVKHSNGIRAKRGELPLRFDVTHAQ